MKQKLIRSLPTLTLSIKSLVCKKRFRCHETFKIISQANTFLVRFYFCYIITNKHLCVKVLMNIFCNICNYLFSESRAKVNNSLCLRYKMLVKSIISFSYIDSIRVLPIINIVYKSIDFQWVLWHLAGYVRNFNHSCNVIVY